MGLGKHQPTKKKTSAPRPEPRAAQYLGELCKSTGQLPGTSSQAAITNLGPPTDVVEPDSEEEEADEAEDENDERDALQERAAEVAVDSACVPPETDLEAHEVITSTLFAPPMPKLEFTVIRHMFRGTRHWCVKGAHIICQERLCPSYDRNKYSEATTHEDPFCLDCLQTAEKDYNVDSPERFAHGEKQPQSADDETKNSMNNVKSDRRAFLDKFMKRASSKDAEAASAT